MSCSWPLGAGVGHSFGTPAIAAPTHLCSTVLTTSLCLCVRFAARALMSSTVMVGSSVLFRRASYCWPAGEGGGGVTAAVSKG